MLITAEVRLISFSCSATVGGVEQAADHVQRRVAEQVELPRYGQELLGLVLHILQRHNDRVRERRPVVKRRNP